MCWSCEGFQPGTPLRQPAPATSFVRSSLQCTLGPGASLQTVPTGGDREGTPPHGPAPSLGPAATAICRRAGGRTTPPWGPGPARAVGHSLAPSGCCRALGLPPLPQDPLLAGTQNVLSASLPSDVGAARSPAGLSSLKPKTKRGSDGPTSAGTVPPSLASLLSFFTCVFVHSSPPHPHPIPTFCHHYYNKYKGSAPKKRLQKHK